MKFKIIKRFSLEFLGEEWVECYINLKPLSIADVKSKLPVIAKLQEDGSDIAAGVDLLLELLTDKFIDGKVVNSEGVVSDLLKEDLPELPVEVIGRAFSFLSSKESQNS